MAPIPPDLDLTQLIVAEYNNLRSEIVQLIRLQFQVTTATMVAFGAILSVGFQARNAAVILIYPLLSLLLGIVWLFKAHMITRIAAYIRVGIEDRVGHQNLGWEHFVQDTPLPRGRFAHWGLRAIFPVTSIVAIVASLAVASPGVTLLLLYGLAFSVTIATIAVFVLWGEPSPELPPRSTRSRWARRMSSRLIGLRPSWKPSPGWGKEMARMAQHIVDSNAQTIRACIVIVMTAAAWAIFR